MAIHVAIVTLMQVDSLGNIINKETATMDNLSTKQLPVVTRPRSVATEHRVVVDPTNTNTNGNPTVQVYLTREEADGYLLQHMDQTFIVTRNPA